MANDFFGVEINAWIETFDPIGGVTEFHLWNPSVEAPNQLPEELKALSSLAYVSEVQIALRLGITSEVSLTLTPPFDEGIALINSPLIQWGVGRLNVQVGYSTGSGERASKVFGGLLQKPEVRIGTDIVISLNALGVGYQLAAADAIRADQEQVRSGKTYAEVIEMLLSRYGNAFDLSELWSDFGVKTAIGEQGVDHPLFKAPTGKPVPKKDGKVHQDVQSITFSNKNDWFFINDIIGKHGLRLEIDDKVIRIRNPGKFLDLNNEKKNYKKFFLRGITDPSRNLYPALSIESPSSFVWLRHGMGKQYSSGVSADRNIVSYEANDKTSPARVSGGGTWNTERKIGNVLQNLSVVHPGDPETMKGIISGEYQNQNWKKGIHLYIDTVGIPSLEPGELVFFSGSGTDINKGNGVFDGHYGVTEVNHSIGIGGFTTRFLGIGNFIPKQFKEIYQKAEENSTAAEAEAAHNLDMMFEKIDMERIRNAQTAELIKKDPKPE